MIGSLSGYANVDKHNAYLIAHAVINLPEVLNICASKK